MTDFSDGCIVGGFIVGLLVVLFYRIHPPTPKRRPASVLDLTEAQRRRRSP